MPSGNVNLMINTEFVICAKYAQIKKDDVKTFGEFCLRRKHEFKSREKN